MVGKRRIREILSYNHDAKRPIKLEAKTELGADKLSFKEIGTLNKCARLDSLS
jgi:hypothetical protein